MDYKNTAKMLLTCADIGSISTLDEFEEKIGNPISISLQNSSSVEIETISAQVSSVLAVFFNPFEGPHAAIDAAPTGGGYEWIKKYR